MLTFNLDRKMVPAPTGEIVESHSAEPESSGMKPDEDPRATPAKQRDGD